jgi:predicted aconitase with swiveling domain
MVELAERKIVLRGHRGVGGVAEGEAVVSQEPISYYSDIDQWTGDVIGKTTLPAMYGMNFAGKILVFPTGKGGIFSPQLMADLAQRGLGPKAMVNVWAHPVFVVAAIWMQIPLVDRLDQDPMKVIETGDWVKVDAPNGLVEITKKQSQK